METNPRQRRKLGDLLVEVGVITKEQLEDALREQRETGGKIGEILVSKGYISQHDMIQVLEFQLGIPHADLEKYNIDPEAIKMIPEHIARRHGLVPIKKDDAILTIAMFDPFNIYAIDDVKIYSGMEVQAVISTLDDINKVIDRFYGSQKAFKAVEEFKKEQDSGIKITSEFDESQALEEINNSPAVKLVNSIIEQAVKNRASDIHIEPFEHYVKIRYRTDGRLYEVMRPDISIMSAISARIKIVGGMNIAEKRIPQDGRFTVSVDNREVDLRVSVLPTVFGEKIVIRLADKSKFLIHKDELGFEPSDKEAFEKMIKNPHGIILVTGPTGSGKSTTLYSALNEINRPDVNIITIEDPVECLIEGINQVNVNPKAGMTFAAGLRSILRQDPDIIMIGEIRDSETAQIAVRAAITGHLVLSTLHTNDAPGAIIRLIDMGIEPFLVASSVVGVIAQRLVKKICSNCKRDRTITEEEAKILELPSAKDVKIYYGRGCPMCNKTGYSGRSGVYEVMLFNRQHKDLINKNCTEDELRDLALKHGMKTLKENAKILVLKGVTTIEEMMRIAHQN